jgi:non-specific serine/threonine protein kinase/serine/threonine-protein kinase
MGTVYAAEQEQPHRSIALKVIRAGHASAERIQRFAREAEVLGRLQHPGIAQVYEAGTAQTPEGPQPFFAMELVQGRPLTDQAREAGLNLRERLELFVRVCEAVHYAHQRGVIHRDLKPANILVDETGQPKILDFGVARLTDADVNVTRQTSMGEIVGTLQYMSPEQVNADPLEIDTRSDVYSLGVILYELVSDRVPYDLSAAAVYEALRIILSDDPAPLGSIDRGWRGDVETIVAKALEKEKVRRYGSAMELASDVRHFLSHEPIAARPASVSYQLGRFARRNRALVTGVAVAMLLLVLGTTVSTWQAVRASAAERLAESRRGEAVEALELAEIRRNEALASQALAELRQTESETQRAVAEQAREAADAANAIAVREQRSALAAAEQARREASKAQAVSGFLQEMLTSADPGNTRGRDPTLIEVLDAAAERVQAGGLDREPEVNAAVHDAIGRTYYGLGDFAKAQPHADSAYEINRRTFGSASLLLAEGAAWQGNILRAKGDLDAAEQKVEEALAGFRQHHPPDHDAIVESLHHLGHRRYQQGRNREAEALHREALALRRQRHTTPDTAVAASLRSLGNFLTYDSRSAEAEPLLVEAVEILRTWRGGELYPDVVRATIELADAKRGSADNAGAETVSREALALALRLWGDEHPGVADAMMRLGSSLFAQRKQEEAEAVIRDALAMRRTLLGDGHPDVQVARTELGRLVMLSGRYDEADSLFSAALEARIALLGPDNPAVISSLGDRATVAEQRGDAPAAERYYREGLPKIRAAGIAWLEADFTRRLGTALRMQGRFDEAESQLQDALRQQRSLHGEIHLDVSDILVQLGQLENGRRNPARAEALFRDALEIMRQATRDRYIDIFALVGIATARELQGDTASAEPMLRESLAIMRAVRPEGDGQVVLAQLWLGAILCAAGKEAEGEAELRAASAAFEGNPTISLVRHRLQGALGDCTRRQSRYAEAEPLLLASQEGINVDPGATPQHKKQAVGRLMALYEAWSKPDQLALWRARLPQ